MMNESVVEDSTADSRAGGIERDAAAQNVETLQAPAGGYPCFGAPAEETESSVPEVAPKSQDRQDCSECIKLVMSAAQHEATAMDRDREERGVEAIGLYTLAAEELQHAVDACPSGHPDEAVIKKHAEEIRDRIEYLKSSSGDSASSQRMTPLQRIPLETHINGVSLTMTMPASPGDEGEVSEHQSESSTCPAEVDPKIRGAATVIAGTAGLLLLGPISAAVAAVGAWTATMYDRGKVGEMARSLGKTGIDVADCVSDKVKEFDEEHKISENAQPLGSAAAALAADASQKIKKIDEEHRIHERARGSITAAGSAASLFADSCADRMKTFDEKHKVVEKTKTVTSSAATKVQEIDEKLHISQNASKAASASATITATGAQVVDEKLHLSENAKMVATTVSQINEKHRFTDIIGKTISSSIAALAHFATSSSSKNPESTESSSSNNPESTQPSTLPSTESAEPSAGGCKTGTELKM